MPKKKASLIRQGTGLSIIKEMEAKKKEAESFFGPMALEYLDDKA